MASTRRVALCVGVTAIWLRAMVAAQTSPSPPSEPMIECEHGTNMVCTDADPKINANGKCEDSECGTSCSIQAFRGTDCTDCGARCNVNGDTSCPCYGVNKTGVSVFAPSPPHPPSEPMIECEHGTNMVCTDADPKVETTADGHCDDGECGDDCNIKVFRGTDCTDCGARCNVNGDTSCPCYGVNKTGVSVFAPSPSLPPSEPPVIPPQHPPPPDQPPFPPPPARESEIALGAVLVVVGLMAMVGMVWWAVSSGMFSSRLHARINIIHIADRSTRRAALLSRLKPTSTSCRSTTSVWPW